MGRLEPDAGEVIKAKRNMRIAYLAQEFDVEPTHTVREEFYSVYQQQIKVRPGPHCGIMLAPSHTDSCTAQRRCERDRAARAV